MSNEPVYIKEIEIADYKCFKGKHKFSFTDEKGDWCRWTVFLGNNNTGKTNLLKEIAMFEDWSQLISINRKTTITFEENSTHEIIKLSEKEWNRFARNDDTRVYAYGVTRKIKTNGIFNDKDKYYKDNAGNLFYNKDLINFEDWLFQLDYAANNQSAQIINRKRTAEKRDLLIKVIKSEIFPGIDDIRFSSNEKAENCIEYQTKDGWYRLYELGYGYQAMLAWLMDFCKKMFDRYSDSENPLEKPAILLVDEIDLHLHPYWQRIVINFLSRLLPQTQFIVTTHSPFILQSMDYVNLYTLRREGDHTISKHLGNQSFIGWSIEEILREIMELGDDVYTDHYQKLSKQFYEAIAENDKQKAETAYDALVKILNPESVERKLMKIQLSQITSSL